MCDKTICEIADELLQKVILLENLYQEMGRYLKDNSKKKVL